MKVEEKHKTVKLQCSKCGSRKTLVSYVSKEINDRCGHCYTKMRRLYE